MADKPTSGEILGIPYNFERPNLSSLISAYWQPGKGMLVEKPFGIGYTLNLANWRAWVALAVVGTLVFQERGGTPETDADMADDEEGPVEVVVDD